MRTDRRDDPAVESPSPHAELLSDGPDFSLFQAVDLIDRIALQTMQVRARDPLDALEQRLDALEQRRRAGGYVSPSKENIRFRGVDSMGFPAADIARIWLEESPSEGPLPARYVIEANCLGLYGPDSPLPDYVNEGIVAYDRTATALRDFLDLFNHRLLILLCRIGRRYRHARVFDGEATDEISLFCGALIGELDPFDLQPDIGRAHRLRNATRLGLFSLPAAGLEQVVADLFPGVQVQLEEFVRRTVPVSDEQRNRLGQQGNLLGETAIVGDRVESCDKIRLWLGPLSPARWEDFLPGGPERHRLETLLRRLLPAPLAYDIVLLPGPEVVAPTRLGAQGRLALDAWLDEPQDEKNISFRIAA